MHRIVSPAVKTLVTFAVLGAVLATGCKSPGGAKAPEEPVPVEAPAPATEAPPPKPEPVRDPELEQKLAQAELRLLEKEQQLEEVQARLDDARQEVVRAMAKQQSLATRAEAASAIAEAELAAQSLTAGPAVAEVRRLMQQSTAEFDRKNYGGALYLASQAKRAAIAAQGQLASEDHGTLRPGETAFALPLRLQTTARSNVRTGPGSEFDVSFILPANAPVIGRSYVEQWVRVTDDQGRKGWIFQSLVSRRP